MAAEQSKLGRLAQFALGKFFAQAQEKEFLSLLPRKDDHFGGRFFFDAKITA